MKPYLANAARTAAVLQKHHISARKKFGQNFLIDPSVLEDTIAASGIGPEDFVLEIGPGIGTLTQYLADAARRVYAVEIDRSLFPVLEDTLSGFENVTVAEGDILKTDIAELVRRENDGKPIRVAANLPYYITTPIILMLLTSEAPVLGMTFMVQKEVADRMCSGPGSKDYGALSLAVQYYAEPVLVRDVSPSSFTPRPGVVSSVIHLRIWDNPPVRVKDEKLLFRVIRASFNQRRKKLVNGLISGLAPAISKEMAERAMDMAGIDPGIRGEALPLEGFAALADALYGVMKM